MREEANASLDLPNTRARNGGARSVSRSFGLARRSQGGAAPAETSANSPNSGVAGLSRNRRSCPNLPDVASAEAAAASSAVDSCPPGMIRTDSSDSIASLSASSSARRRGSSERSGFQYSSSGEQLNTGRRGGGEGPASLSTPPFASGGAARIVNLAAVTAGAGTKKDDGDDSISVCSRASELSALSAATERRSLTIRPFKPYENPMQRAMRRSRHSAPTNLSGLRGGFGSGALGGAAAGLAASSSRGNAEWGTVLQGGLGGGGGVSGLRSSASAATAGDGFGMLRGGGHLSQSGARSQQIPAGAIANPFLQESASLRELLSNARNDSFSGFAAAKKSDKR